MSKRNLWILAAVAAVIALVLAVALTMPKQAVPENTVAVDDASSMVSDGDGQTAEPAVTVQVTDAPEATATDLPASTTESPIRAYLVISVGNVTYAPMALLEDKDYTVRQGTGDDSPVHVVHVTKDSIPMKSSNCEGQDCIGEGTVTLDNMGTRILGNGIYCLPHQVALQLLTAEEAAPYLK